MNILEIDLDHGTIIAPSGSEIWCDFGMMKGEAYRDDFPLGRSLGPSGEGLQVFHLPGAWMMITKVAVSGVEMITGEETETEALKIVDWFRRQCTSRDASLAELAGLWVSHPTTTTSTCQPS